MCTPCCVGLAHPPLQLLLSPPDRSGSISIDACATINEARLDLSRREFDLLAVFAANPGIVLSRMRLLELVWGYDFDVDTNVVDVFVGYVRRKLDAAGAHA